MEGGELAGGKKWTAYFGAKGLASVYRVTRGHQPTQSWLSSVLSRNLSVSGTDIPGEDYREQAGSIKKMILLLFSWHLLLNTASLAGFEVMEDTRFCKAQFFYACSCGIVPGVQASLGFLP